MCRAEPDTSFELQAADLGYPSPLSLSAALDEWIEIRRWCLFTLTCALIMLEGGVDAVLASQLKAPMLTVVPAHLSEHYGNPALAFRFGHAVIVDKDADDSLRESWDEIRTSVNLSIITSDLAFLDTERRNQRLAPPVGSFPVVFFVSRTNVANCHTFAPFHLPLRHVNGNLKDPACGHVRAACEELVHIMEALLSDELVYRRANDPRRPEPEWGFYERVGRRRRKWQWRRIPQCQDSWRLWEKLTEDFLRDHASGLTPRQVLTLFDYGRLGTKWWYVCATLLRRELGLMTAPFLRVLETRAGERRLYICAFRHSTSEHYSKCDVHRSGYEMNIAQYGRDLQEFVAYKAQE